MTEELDEKMRLRMGVCPECGAPMSGGRGIQHEIYCSQSDHFKKIKEQEGKFRKFLQGLVNERGANMRGWIKASDAIEKGLLKPGVKCWFWDETWIDPTPEIFKLDQITSEGLLYWAFESEQSDLMEIPRVYIKLIDRPKPPKIMEGEQ